MDKKKLLFGASALLLTASTLLLKRNRRYAVRAVNKQRKEHGHFNTLFSFIKNEDHDQFFKYTRMSTHLFDHLLTLLEDSLAKDPTKNPLSPAHRLAMTLHYLAEGCSQQQIAWDYYVGISTVHVVVKETCDAIWDKLCPLYLKTPTHDNWTDIASGFFNKWNMPNCIGALDGKHIHIQCPKHSGSTYFNYKKTFSIVLMAMCDADYRFIFVDIGASGANHDSSVFKNSEFGKALLNNELNVPNSIALPGTNINIPYFAVADQAFPLNKIIMRPYPGDKLSDKKEIFNYRLSRARRCIENAFGILVQRWRILRKPITAELEMSERIVKACIALHNYLQIKETDLPLKDRRYCPTGYADYVDVTGQLRQGQWRQNATNLHPVGRAGSNNSSREIQQNRDHLCDYFVSREGEVHWQWAKIARGRIP